MATTRLAVIICGVRAGILAQDAEGHMSYQYDSGYDGPPLSLSMPISNRIYREKVVRPYLFGLLPDDERQRRAIAREHDVSANNPVALLARIGLDCPGGVQFCAENTVAVVSHRMGAYRSLADSAIAERLRVIQDEDDASWMGSEESWSLGGNQGKFALAWHDGQWCECLGAAPTTHIFKYGVAGFKLEALNEYICMKAASLCEIPAAQVSYDSFRGMPALIVKRYDRAAGPSGEVSRLHQEDLCQSLGVMPSQKYTADGGPSAKDVVMLLSSTSRASANLYQFTRMLFFNCLVGAPDAHAKNYSLLLGRGGDALLAPLYDVASGLAYERMRRSGRLAMSIGGENRFGRVGAGAVGRYAGSRDPEILERMCAVGLDADACIQIMRELAERVPSAFCQAFDDAEVIPGAGELRERLEGPVRENCRRTLALL